MCVRGRGYEEKHTSREACVVDTRRASPIAGIARHVNSANIVSIVFGVSLEGIVKPVQSINAETRVDGDIYSRRCVSFCVAAPRMLSFGRGNETNRNDSADFPYKPGAVAQIMNVVYPLSCSWASERIPAACVCACALVCVRR